jgi:hypothetical protein
VSESRLGSLTHGYVQQTLLRDLSLVIAIGLGLLFLLNRNTVLPSRFLGDEATIQSFAQQLSETPMDSSYNSVAIAYRLLGLAYEPLLAALLGFSVGCVPYLLVIREMHGQFRGRLSMPLLVLGVLLTAVYMGTFSKEVFIAPIISLFIILKPSVSRTLLLLALMCGYAYFFRSYWYFLAFSVLVLLLSRRIFSRWSGTFATAPLLVIVGTLLIASAMGVPGDYYRSSVNTYREALQAPYGDVNSLIPRYVEFAEPFGAIANNMLSFLFLQFPLPLLIKLSPYYVLISVFTGVLWIAFYKSVVDLSNTVSDGDTYKRLTRAAVFLLSFLVTQSFFEPDYGSALKHLTPSIPLFLWIYLQSNISAARTPRI